MGDEGTGGAQPSPGADVDVIQLQAFPSPWTETERKHMVNSRPDRIEQVNPEDLLPTQDSVIKTGVDMMVEDWEPKGKVVVAQYGGELFIVDGHHRVVAAGILGKKITASIFDMD